MVNPKRADTAVERVAHDVWAIFGGEEEPDAAVIESMGHTPNTRSPTAGWFDLPSGVRQYVEDAIRDIFRTHDDLRALLSDVAPRSIEDLSHLLTIDDGMDDVAPEPSEPAELLEQTVREIFAAGYTAAGPLRAGEVDAGWRVAFADFQSRYPAYFRVAEHPLSARPLNRHEEEAMSGTADVRCQCSEELTAGRPWCPVHDNVAGAHEYGGEQGWVRALVCSKCHHVSAVDDPPIVAPEGEVEPVAICCIERWKPGMAIYVEPGCGACEISVARLASPPDADALVEALEKIIEPRGLTEEGLYLRLVEAQNIARAALTSYTSEERP